MTSREGIAKWWVPGTVSVLLLVALHPEIPYGYYHLLRVVVFCLFGYYALREMMRDPERARPWIVLGVALVYNPFIKLALGRPLWSLVNLLTIAILIWYHRTNPKSS